MENTPTEKEERITEIKRQCSLTRMAEARMVISTANARCRLLSIITIIYSYSSLVPTEVAHCMMIGKRTG